MAPHNPDSVNVENSGDDLFGEINRAIALKRMEFVKQGLLKPNLKKEKAVSDVGIEGIEVVEAEEVVDLEEIKEFQGFILILEEPHKQNQVKFSDEAQMVEPKFKMILAELLDKRGSVAVVASIEICIDETLRCKALVIVENTTVVLPALAASFYRNCLRIAYYMHGENKLESPNTTPNAVLLQKLMAKMLHNGTEAVVMEASSNGLALGRCNENKSTGVHPLKFELSLFETLVLINAPQGILEISFGLLGRHNIYNILAVVAVGIAFGAPLEDIVRGIEDIDGVPGRCKLIDEEQAFGVIVDYAHTLEACLNYLMLLGEDYLKYGENDYYLPLPNGHRLFLHDIIWLAVQAAVAMCEEVSFINVAAYMLHVVAGKGHETYQIEGYKKEFFDVWEECREALHYVDELHQAGIDTSEFLWRLVNLLLL
ncbi:hypothetical protein HHK36_020603 [Tetracentron sinense]|uniref:Mur ligase central domain-containing protein n=1 Tax=Tetracentron sinense TaxID=13715 RepID=A0A834YVP8_TETSI|nr:hypothetical protein HHK36_020603 [Tetracentron sinense]